MIANCWGGISIYLSIQSKKGDVVAFLKKLNALLLSADFNIDTDLTLITKKKREDEECFSTPYTLLDLDYDMSDVAERLKELTIEEYSETKIDKDDINPLLLYVFGKVIDDKLVYIKLKIRGDQKQQILCVSFHYARDEMKFPYA